MHRTFCLFLFGALLLNIFAYFVAFSQCAFAASDIVNMRVTSTALESKAYGQDYRDGNLQGNFWRKGYFLAIAPQGYSLSLRLSTNRRNLLPVWRDRPEDRKGRVKNDRVIGYELGV